MTEFASQLASRGRFLLFLLRVTLGSMAFVLTLALLWRTWGFLAVVPPLLAWLYLARGWFVFALFVAFDAVWFAAARSVVLLPQLDRLAEREERDRRYFNAKSHAENRGARLAATFTAFTNPLTPLLFMTAGFLAGCPEDDGAPGLARPGRSVPGRKVFSDWHRISGHRAPA